MANLRLSFPLLLCALVVLLSIGFRPHQQDARPMSARQPVWMSQSLADIESELVSRYGEPQRARIHRGLHQVSEFWRQDDGDAAALKDFAGGSMAGTQADLDTMFTRFEWLLEQLDGHMTEIGHAFRLQADLDRGPLMPFDEKFAGYDPSAHVTDDFFGNKIAFTILLNFPLTTLDQRLAEGDKWTRRQWAEARLVDRFSKRVPAEVNLKIAAAAANAEQYIADYNIWMHHLLNERGERLFPPKLRLLSHWNLRDEIKANYSEGETGRTKQRMIQKVMERIVTQTIPAVVVNNPRVDWNPFTNDVKPSTVVDGEALPSALVVNSDPEPDTRYAVLLSTYHAAALADPYSPTAPTLIARRFDEDRQIPEARVRVMLEQILLSPAVAKVGALIERRLGRPLEPFDIWYNGFRPRGTYTETQLDEIVRKKYPTAQAYRDDIPNLLTKLGFTPERASFLAGHILVEPARGSGHASAAAMRTEPARLRTRVEKGGMDYKGFNIAVHEMGHNVEQTFSLVTIDHTLLQGVPNTAFTEALAFVFQGHDLELLGLTSTDPKAEALRTLNDFWGAYEIAGVALVDMAVWHWMYDHPAATPASLKEATLGIARDIWNRYYAPVFKTKDVVLLAVYSHMIDSFMYLPDYPLGHLIAHQVEARMNQAGSIGPEFERMATAGRIAPDLWMKNATGGPVGAEALLKSTARALNEIQ